MNNTRRKEIADLGRRLEALREELSSVKDELEVVRDEEQEYRDNMPESFANGEKGQAADDAIGNLEYAFDMLDAFDLDELSNYLEAAAE